MRTCSVTRALLPCLALLTTALAAGATTGEEGAPLLLVCNKHEDSMSFVDPVSLRPVATIPAGPNPHEIVLSADRRFAFLSNYAPPGNTISVIDLVQRKHIRQISTGEYGRIHGAAIAPDGKNAYFTAGQSGCVVETDTATQSFTRTIPTHGKISHMVLVSPDGRLLYTANIETQNVSVLERTSGELVTQIPCGKGAEGMCFTPDGKTLWVGNQEAGSITTIDVASNTAIETFPCPGMPVRIRFTLDGKTALVSSWTDPGELVVLDTVTHREIKRLGVGGQAIGLELSPDGKRAFVGCEHRDGVHVIDLEHLSVKGKVITGDGSDAMAWWVPPVAAVHAADAPQKSLPLPGETFFVQGRPAFVILPRVEPRQKDIPWVWYAPTLPGLPGDEEKWMFERFTRAGSAVAGIDVGESFGSPAGRTLYSAFYDELTKNRGFASKAVMLGRSRGGLMTLSWATENADKVAGFAGIYPVCSLTSYPGVEKACGAYHLTVEELSMHLADHNPIDRLAALAKAGVPLFAIHGDSDTVVPLEANSGEMQKRYEALGGAMQLIIPPGQGHNMWTGFFQCQELVDFVLAQQQRAARPEFQPSNRVVSMNYTAVFDAPPKNVPTKAMPDGPLLGNGDVGVAMAGPPEAQRFHIGKNDFWTRQPGDAKVITVGAVTLSIPALQGARYRQEQDLAHAEVRGTFTKDGLTVRTRSWVDANANLLLTQVQCEGGPVTASVRLTSGPAGESAGNWFTRKADDLPGKGREVAVVTRIIGVDGLEATVEPGETITVATAILSDLDAPDCLVTAKSMVAELTPQAIEARTAQHRDWWSAFWARSFIEIPGKEIEKHWYAALYALGSCSRAGKVAPGLWGNWLTTDTPNWHGDFHLNYNFQAPYYLAYGTNHADLSLPFYQAVLESMDNGRAMAQRHGWKGVHFPVCIGPWGLSPESPDGDWGQRSNAAYAALNFIWHWQYTQDVDFLRQTAYPYLREAAAFWEDYLKLEEGRYVIHNDSIHEGSGPDFNPILSLGLVRALFKNMLVMSAELGVDADKKDKWQDILDRLSAFPLQERNGETVFRYSEKGMAWCDGNTLGIQHIFPAGCIGLDSAPKLLEISRNMIDAMHRWTDNNGFSSWYSACARVGYDPNRILEGLRHECDIHSAPNLLLQYGGGGIENCSGFLAVNEMLLQSHEGVIRLFPCWPRELDARFGTLRAVGAFLVSAVLKKEVISGVTLVSEKGRDCTLVNPWPGRDVLVVRNGKEAETLSGGRFMVKTSVGETLEFRAVPYRTSSQRQLSFGYMPSEASLAFMRLSSISA